MGERSEAGLRRGPRGGTTTITGDRVRKNLWITFEEAETLRRRAFATRRTETDLIREGLRLVLELEQENGAS